MFAINTEITIHATLEKVWKILTEFDLYPQWNPFIQEVQGTAHLGQRLRVVICPPGKKKMVFKPKIIALLEQRELTWLGSLIIPGIFDGQHQFLLNQIDHNQVKLIHAERFSGLLSKPIFQMINQSTQAGFEAMNAALKKRCELAE